MKYFYLVTLFLISISYIGYGQSATNLQPLPPHSETCGFDDIHRERMATDASYRMETEAFSQLMKNHRGSRSGTIYRVPVVIHVMHTGEAVGTGNNISEEAIIQGMEELNERFRKVTGSLGDGSGVDVEVEFALAVRDESGNCTNGIVRYDLSSDATYAASGVFRSSAGITDAALKAYSVWDQTKYYNIWLVTEIDNNGGGSGVQGYAYFASSHGTTLDGAVMLAGKFATSGNTTLTHEMGHAFNLYHTFEGDAGGGGCPTNTDCLTDGDELCDTPPHIRSSSNCNSAGTNSCDGGSSNALFVHHYMDYSSDDCQNMFSSDQKGRMQTALTVTRASFLSSNGNTSLDPPSSPTADFIFSAPAGCTGNTISFKDNSLCSPNTYVDDTWTGISYNWDFDNNLGTSYTSTAQNPDITFAATGAYDVALTITNAHGTDILTKQGAIVITGTATAACVPGSNNEGNFGQTVSNVTFNEINNTTSSSVNVSVTDYSCSANTTVLAGNTYNMDVTVNAGASGSEVFEVYIDYNNDGVFSNPSEMVHSGSTAANTSATLSTAVTIPGTAVKDVMLRMRVIGETGSISANERACLSNFFVGDVEDYGVFISSNLADVAISANPGTTISYGTSVTFTATPTNGGAGPTYQWYKNEVLQSGETATTYVSSTFVDQDRITCEMTSNMTGVVGSPATSLADTMTVTGPPLSDFTVDLTSVCETGTATFSDASLLAPTSWSWSFEGGTPSTSNAQNPAVVYNTAGTYNVTLTASNGLGTGTTTTKSNYITAMATPGAICNSFTRSNSPTAGIGITKVVLNTINNITDYDGAVFNDYACSNTTILEKNTNYDITVIGGASNNQWLRVYIDYNDDGDFDDTGEEVFAPANGKGSRSGSFTTPASPTTGEFLRMRVISDFTTTTPGACTTPLQYGQVEDYAVFFNGCTSPTVGLTPSNVSCNGGTTGSVSSSVSGGETPYTYLWSNSLTTASITGLAAGVYTVTVTENATCTTIESTTITEPGAITISEVGNNISCNGQADGSIDATVSGGTTPYTYLWSNAETIEDITGLSAGTFTLTVTDNNSCVQISATTTITEPTVLTADITYNNTTCNGANDWQAQIAAGGGTTAYSYLWSTTATTSLITGLAVGTYAATVTDANSCVVTDAVTISNPSALGLTATVTDVLCNGGSSGVITPTASGGGTPYSYLWSDGKTIEVNTGLTIGTYSLTVTDFNTCNVTISNVVSEPTAVTITLGSTSVTCNGQSDGSASSTVAGGTTAYTYLWSNTSTLDNITGIPAGTYTLSVTDANACVNTESVTVSQPMPLLETSTSSDEEPGAGYGINFDGSNDFINHTGAISFTSHSISAWVKTSGNSVQTVVCPFISSTHFAQLYIDNGNAAVEVSDNGGNKKITKASSTINDGNWHHISYTFDATGTGTVNLYVDGVLDNGTIVQNDNLTFSLSATSMHIGNDYASTNNFGGMIDEVVIWDTAYAQVDIRDNMCVKVTTNHTHKCHLIAYYRFDENTGTTARDWAGDNNGTLILGPTYAKSAAPIGDASAYDYNGGSSSANLAHANGDDLTISITSGTPNGVHVYRIDEAPNTINGIDGSDNDRFFGTFICGTGTYTSSYNYAGHTYGVASSESEILYYKRAGSDVTSWSNTGSAPNTVTDIIEITGETNYLNEYILHLNRTLWIGATDTDWGTSSNWTPSTVPDGGTNVTILASSNDPVLDMARTVGSLVIDTGSALSLQANTLTVENNFTNRGTLTYGTGTVRMNGTDAQIMNGSTGFYHLEIDNGSGVTISSGTDSILNSLTLTNGLLTTNDSLTFISNSSGTSRLAEITGGSISGNIITERYLPTSNTEGWRFLASPVSGETLEGWDDDMITSGFPGTDDENFNFISMYSYDESVAGDENDNGWTAATNTSNSIGVGQGFAVWVEDDNVRLDLKGDANTGDISLPVSYTDNGNAAQDGWTLVGNPYMSTIDWDDADWVKTNMNNAVYVWDHFNNVTASYVNGVSNDGGTQYVASSQSFIVQANAASPVLTAKEGVKVANDVSHLRQSSGEEVLRLELTGNGHTKQTTLVFDEDAKPSFENFRDARNLNGLSTAVNFASVVLNEYYSINSLPYSEELNIPLKTSTAVGGSFQMALVDVPDTVKCVTLFDHETGLETDLLQDSAYTFFLSENTVGERFKLYVCFSDSINNIITQPMDTTSTTSITENVPVKGQVINVYPNPNNGTFILEIFSNEEVTYDLQITNALGQIVQSKSLQLNSGNNQVPISIHAESSGFHFIRLSNSTTVLVRKIVVRE